jgi:ferredoxin
MERWRVRVDRDACTGSGLCLGTAPEHFALGPDRRSRPVAPDVGPDDAVVAAAECCPMQAIEVVDARTGRTVAPDPDL